MKLDKWIDEQRWLPKILRDFRDQKDVFKFMHSMYDGRAQAGDPPMPNRVSGHIYVIDWFLRFMALRGYTLQKCKSKTSDGLFHDLGKEIRNFKDRQAATLKAPAPVINQNQEKA